MKHKTKKHTAASRYSGIIDHYMLKVVDGRPVTADEISQWATDKGLIPVPGIRDSEEAGADWDRRFAEITNG